MRVLDLFSGIGGFSLGLKRAGWRTVGFCEIDPYCRAVLNKHWPDVPIFEDIRNVTAELIRQQCGGIDVICAGPPCQPASVAGQRKGSGDDRWLWPELLRVVFEVNPVWLLFENPRGVTSIRVEGLEFSEWLARELDARGYELLPIELAAEDVGAPHRRERVWFVAHPSSPQRRPATERRIDVVDWADAGREEAAGGFEFRGEAMANPASLREREPHDAQCAIARQWSRQDTGGGSDGAGVAHCDPNGARPQEHSRERSDAREELAPIIRTSWPARPGEPQHEWEEPRVIEVESGVGGATHGISSRLAARRRVAALKALGNAVVPACAEIIGRMINRYEEETRCQK